MAEFDDFDDPYSRMVLDECACFLCGEHMVDGKTEEHVFPKWLQQRHDLWDQRILLLNRKRIPYRQLKVPCCHACNNEHLGRVENTVREAIDKGYHACIELDPLIIFQWLGKMFYGILRKELNLLADRRDSSKGNIVPVEMIEGYNNLHGFLQSVRRPFEFQPEPPFSVLVANLHDLGGSSSYFFRDSTHLMTASLRTGGVGFIVAFEDCGFNRNTYGAYLDDVGGRKLHPIQFDELYAKVMFQVQRLNRTGRFLTVASADGDQPTLIHTFPPTSEPLPWNQEAFSRYLANVVGPWLRAWEIPEDSLFLPPDRVLSWMTNEDDSLNIIGADDVFDAGDSNQV